MAHFVIFGLCFLIYGISALKKREVIVPRAAAFPALAKEDEFTAYVAWIYLILGIAIALTYTWVIFRDHLL